MYPVHVVFLLLTATWFVQSLQIDSDQSSNKINGDLLKELLARLDAKDVADHLLRKRMDEKDMEINELQQSLDQHKTKVNDLQKIVGHMLRENKQLKKLYSKCAKPVQSMMVDDTTDNGNNYLKLLSAPTIKIIQDSLIDVEQVAKLNNSQEIGRARNVLITAPLQRDLIGQKQQKQVERRHAGTDLVAFFATLTNHATNLGVGQNLKFDHVVTNVGSAYNQHAGAFFAPVSGVYVFMSTLLSFGGHNAHFQLVRNGNIVCYMFVAGGGDGNNDTSGGSYVLELNKGDVIAIQNMDSGENVLGSNYSFFSGFLLKQLEQDPSIVG